MRRTAGIAAAFGLAVAIAPAGGACVSTEGDVLTSAGGDGGNGGSDGGGVNADAAGDAAGACEMDGPCAQPGPGNVTVCGRVVDLETSEPVIEGAPTVRVFDLVELTLDPIGAGALAEVTPDACGWFQTTLDGIIGPIVVHTGNIPQSGEFERVTTVLTASPGQVVRVNGYALRDATDEVWSSAAGLGGLTFADIGSAVAIFVDVAQPPLGPFQGTPVSGVQLTVGGSVVSDDDFYFGGGDALSRSDLDLGLDATAAPGAAIARSTGMIPTFGGEADGCTFATQAGITIPGTVQVAELAGTCE